MSDDDMRGYGRQGAYYPPYPDGRPYPDGPGGPAGPDARRPYPEPEEPQSVHVRRPRRGTSAAAEIQEAVERRLALLEAAVRSGHQALADQDRRLAAQEARLAAQDARVAELEALVDSLRGARVQEALQSGELTGEPKRRHLANAQAYAALVRQHVRRAAVRLCPVDSHPEDELAECRARAAADLVRLLFDADPAAPPPTVPGLYDGLDAAGHRAARHGEARAALEALAAAARPIAAALRDNPLPAVLDFAADPRTLGLEDADAYNTGGAGVPRLLVAPAYVVDGERPEPLTRPLVFVAPAERG